MSVRLSATPAADEAPPAADKQSYRIRTQSQLASGLILVAFIIGAVILMFPFYYMVIQATHRLDELMTFPPPLLPGSALADNLQKLLKAVPFFQSISNSLFIATSHTILVVFFCSLGGFAFGVYDAPGRNKLFAFMLATMMIPGFVGLIPWFILMRWFGWVNNPIALIIPGIANPFGIFWMRQYVISSVHPELLDAARIDGCTEARIYLTIVLPVIRPALGALAILTFMGNWNNFLQPLIILNEKSKFTLPIALSQLTTFFQMPDYAVMMLGASIGLIPVMIVFLLGAKQFMTGLTAGSIRG